MTESSSLPSNPTPTQPQASYATSESETFYEYDVNDNLNCEDSDMDMNHNSFEEQCGFVLHVMIVLTSMYYTAWILSFYKFSLPILNSTSVDGGGKSQSVLLVSSKEQVPPLWTIIIPIAVIFLFFLIPIVYGGCINRSAVVVTTHNQQTSLSMLQDAHTIRPVYVSPNSITVAENLYDENNATTSNYYRNPMSWEPARNGKSSRNGTATSAIPDICDIDVADINDLLHTKFIKYGPQW